MIIDKDFTFFGVNELRCRFGYFDHQRLHPAKTGQVLTNGKQKINR